MAQKNKKIAGDAPAMTPTVVDTATTQAVVDTPAASIEVEKRKKTHKVEYTETSDSLTVSYRGLGGSETITISDVQPLADRLLLYGIRKKLQEAAAVPDGTSDADRWQAIRDMASQLRAGNWGASPRSNDSAIIDALTMVRMLRDIGAEFSTNAAMSMRSRTNYPEVRERAAAAWESWDESRRRKVRNMPDIRSIVYSLSARTRKSEDLDF